MNYAASVLRMGVWPPDACLQGLGLRPLKWCNSPGTPTPATPGWSAHLR
jgi:hypothetical protein